MNRQKLLQQMLGVTLVALTLVGCSAPAATPVPPTPTQTAVPPTPTATAVPATPTPTLVPGPKPGSWEGEEETMLSKAGLTTISFEIAGDGYIRDFTMVVMGALFPCTVNAQEIPINADGTFVYSEGGKELFNGEFDDDTTVTITFLGEDAEPIPCEEGIEIYSDFVQTVHAEWKEQ